MKLCQTLAPVCLYLEDLDQIVAYLLELSPEAELTLATPRREVTTVEGLSSLGRQEVSELEIRCSVHPRRLYEFVVSIGPESVHLCRTGDTLAHRSAFLGIEALLLARRRGWQRREWLLAAAGLLGPLAGVVFALAQSRLSWGLLYLGALLVGVSLSLLPIYLATKRWSTSRVVLARRQELGVHWEALSGAFIVLALIVVMALVTLGLAFLVRVLDLSVT